jgi:hypothetical protein
MVPGSRVHNVWNRMWNKRAHLPGDFCLVV